MSTTTGKKGRLWDDYEITLALALYLRTPYGKISGKNPTIQALARLLGRSDGSVSLKLANLAACDPEVAEQGKKGFGNGSKRDRIVWDTYIGENREVSLEKLIDNCYLFGRDHEIDIDRIVLGIDDSTVSIPNVNLVDTDRETLVKIRRGQAYFRQTVLRRYENRCVVTGLVLPSLLEAAHIVPWADNKALRLVPQNGLALNPMMHKAYDKNLLGIDADGIIHISDAFTDSAQNDRIRSLLDKVAGEKIIVPKDVTLNRDYLDRHFQDFAAGRIL